MKRMAKRPVTGATFIGSQTRESRTSFNYLVRKSEESGWHGEAEFFGGLQIDNQLKSGGLLDRQLGRVRALQDAIEIARGSVVVILWHGSAKCLQRRDDDG